MKRASLLLIGFLAVSFMSAAQTISDRFNKASYVMVQPTADVHVTKAKPATAVIRFRVNPGFHVNSNKPNSDLLIPTEIKFEAQRAVVVGKPTYPAGEEFALSFSPTQKLSVYQGDVAIAVPVSAAKSAKRGAYKLKGALTYQACNDTSCFPPKTASFELNVNVE